MARSYRQRSGVPFKTLKDVGRSVSMIEESVSTLSNQQVVQPDQHPEILKFYKDNDGIINATVKENDKIKDVVIYPRGNEFCFSMGNIGSKTCKPTFLHQEKQKL